jgi:hypothetical protein
MRYDIRIITNGDSRHARRGHVSTGRLSECIEQVSVIATLGQEALEAIGQSGDYGEVERHILARMPKHLLGKVDRADILEVMQFLRRLAPSVYAQAKDPNYVDLSKVDLFGELSWQYSIAKEMLTVANAGMDPENKLKTLKEAGARLEQAVKLKERLVALASIDEFERAVFEILDEMDPTARDRVLDRLEGLSTGGDSVAERTTPPDADENGPDLLTVTPQLSPSSVPALEATL